MHKTEQCVFYHCFLQWNCTAQWNDRAKITLLSPGLYYFSLSLSLIKLEWCSGWLWLLGYTQLKLTLQRAKCRCVLFYFFFLLSLCHCQNASLFLSLISWSASLSHFHLRSNDNKGFYLTRAKEARVKNGSLLSSFAPLSLPVPPFSCFCHLRIRLSAK